MAVSLPIFDVHSRSFKVLGDLHNAGFLVIHNEKENTVSDPFADSGFLIPPRHARSCGEGRDDTPPEQVQHIPFFRITTTHLPRNPVIGWVFGNDFRICDVLLDQSAAGGISGQQFSVRIDTKRRALIIKNLSKNGTLMKMERGEELYTRVHSQRVLRKWAEIKIGTLEVELRCPDHSKDWDMVGGPWAVFCSKLSADAEAISDALNSMDTLAEYGGDSDQEPTERDLRCWKRAHIKASA